MKNKDLATVYFSKDRPLQLQLAIETNNIHRRLANVTYDDFVLYKNSTPNMDNSYKVLSKKFPDIEFRKEKNFKENILGIIEGYDYVLFVVDDAIFVRKYYFFDMKEAFSFLGTIGFSLRLGSNTTHCYPYNRKNDAPVFWSHEGVYFEKFNWTRVGFGDFGYPLEVSSSVYETHALQGLLENCEYSNPNELEFIMDVNKGLYKEAYPFLACYPLSRAFSAPVNKVQKANNNRSGGKLQYSTINLKALFDEGYKINPLPFVKFIPNGCHQEVEFEFVREG